MLVTLGITGPAFAGKTTICNMLKDCFPAQWHRVTFGYGDALKIECSEATGLPLHLFYSDEPAIKDLLRPLMQWWATEYRRNPVLNGTYDYWVIKAKNRILETVADHDDIANFFFGLHDIRYDNEAAHVKSFGCMSTIIKVEPINCAKTVHTAHSSEKGIDPKYIDYVFINDHNSGLTALQEKVEMLYESVIRPKILL